MSKLEHKLELLSKEGKSGVGAVASARLHALEVFKKNGIPTRRNEDYKYSPVEKIIHAGLNTDELVKSHSIKTENFIIPGMNAIVLRLIDGKFQPDPSSLTDLPKGVKITTLEEALQSKDSYVDTHFNAYASRYDEAISALNTILCTKGLFIYIPEGVQLEKPIHIVSVYSSAVDMLFQSRHLIILGANAKAEVFESFHGTETSAAFTLNSLTEASVGAAASLKYYVLQHAGASCHHLSNIYAGVGKDSHFDTNTLTLSGKWIRNNLRIIMEAPVCDVHLNGMVIASGDQHVDNNTQVDHRFPNGQSNQLYKAILGGRSTGIFNGKIFVQRDAQKTNAYQSSKSILLSDDASINAKPQLEIYADDVKCSHGSSTGKLDESALFYFRSRGIGEENARRLLLGAFCADVLDTVRNEALKSHLHHLIMESLEHA